MPRYLSAIIANSLLFASTWAHGACADLPVELFGLQLGPIKGYPDGLAAGIKREGTAEIVEGVGFESLEGSSHGVAFDRVMVYFDRGVFIGFDAVGSVGGQADLGFAEITSLVERSTGQAPAQNKGIGTIACTDGAELSVAPTKWDNGKHRIRISYKNPSATDRMRAYIREYCADPKRRRPQDACK